MRKPKVKAVPARGAEKTPSTAGQADVVAGLERECEQLKAELAEVRARVAELEKARTDAMDRIDWAIDSLHNLIQRAV